jgi:hypothetical protein
MISNHSFQRTRRKRRVAELWRYAPQAPRAHTEKPVETDAKHEPH